MLLPLAAALSLRPPGRQSGIYYLSAVEAIIPSPPPPQPGRPGTSLAGRVLWLLPGTSLAGRVLWLLLAHMVFCLY